MDYLRALVTRWNPNECKAGLLGSAKRAQMGRNKVLVQQKKLENEIADLLQQGRDEKARIKAESLVLLQKTETAYDIIETLTELVQTRIQYISESKECPVDLITPMASIIYGAKRLQIPEFKTALRQFNAKFGVGFTQSHEDNDSGQVASNLVDVLFIAPPKEGEIHDLLVYIAEKHNIEWIPPRKPETITERNMDANPLKDSSVAVILPSPKVQIDERLPEIKETLASVPPAPTDKGYQSERIDVIPPAPPSPVNDPQYDELMDRLRKLKLDNPGDTKPDDSDKQ
jgi:hypothetical protein